MKARADAVPRTRPCTADDLGGVYRLVDYREMPSGTYTHATTEFPFVLLAFFPGGEWSTMRFDRAPVSLVRAMPYLKPPKSKVPHTGYTLQADGQIVLLHDRTPAFVGRCLVSLEAGNGFEKNDLIFTGGESGNPAELHRLFRAWTGSPLEAATRSFDPAPSAQGLSTVPESKEAALTATPTLPDEPAPIRVTVTFDGPNDGGQRVGLVVTNVARAPLSAFSVAVRDVATNGQWVVLDEDACLAHGRAWQPGQNWSRMTGIRIAVQNVQAHAGAAIFSDGNTWGDPQLLAKLKVPRGTCQWPGS